MERNCLGHRRWRFSPNHVSYNICDLITGVKVAGHNFWKRNIAQFSSVTQSWPTLCNPMDCSIPNFPVHQKLLELLQTQVHRVGDAIQPSHPLSSLSPPAFNLHTEYIMRNARLDKSQAGIKTAGRNINNLRYADDTTLNGRKWRGTKEPLNEGERGEWESWLKTQHSKKLR